MTWVLELLAPIELWIGLILTLMTFSLIIRENVFSRLAQYILVGTVAGYLGVIAIHDILRPQLFLPISAAPFADLPLFALFLLGMLMLVSGIVRIVQTDATDGSHASGSRDESFIRRALYAVGIIPVVLLLGIGLAVAVTGSIQGTLLPQFWRAAETGFAWTQSPETFVSGIITLLVTIGVFLHIYAAPAIQPDADRSNTEQSDLPEQLRMTQLVPHQGTNEPSLFDRIILLWAGLGKRMLWLAAGILFARLVASRLSLLIAQFEQIDRVLKGTQVWQAFMNFIQ